VFQRTRQPSAVKAFGAAAAAAGDAGLFSTTVRTSHSFIHSNSDLSHSTQRHRHVSDTPLCSFFFLTSFCCTEKCSVKDLDNDRCKEEKVNTK
jgi:hypothetical protein